MQTSQDNIMEIKDFDFSKLFFKRINNNYFQIMYDGKNGFNLSQITNGLNIEQSPEYITFLNNFRTHFQKYMNIGIMHRIMNKNNISGNCIVSYEYIHITNKIAFIYSKIICSCKTGE